MEPKKTDAAILEEAAALIFADDNQISGMRL